MTAVGAVPAGAVGPQTLDARLTRSTPEEARLRARAWDLYMALPHPSSARDEDWRRTDVSGLRPEEFIADPGRTDHGDELVGHLRTLAARVAGGAALSATTRNGIRALDNTDLLVAQGITVCSLEQAAVEDPDTLQRALDRVAPVTDIGAHGGARFLALWHAMRWGGTYIHVPAGVQAAIPVIAGYTAAGDSPAIFPATVAVLERHSSLTLVEVHCSPVGDAPLFSDAVSSLVIGEDAQLDHCILQQWGAGAWHIAHHRAVLAAGARLRSFVATLGARTQKVYLEALLEGRGAEARLSGVVVGTGRQHLDHQSLQAHRAPQTTSDLLLKVAVRDAARSVYGGLIDVTEGAQQTNGYVSNRNLILSRRARASGIPRLEIKADDVRCGHGVTAGHIDDDERFYVQARGIPAPDAERLIVRGFMQDALDRCPHAGFAEVVGGLLDDVVDGAVAAGIAAPPETPA